MKNKGFTLIELLAVIVILAIIALIAVPIVLNMIENARKSAAKSSAYGYIDAINNNNELASMKNEDMGNIPDTISDGTKDVSEINIKIKGKKPTSGEVTITNGRVVSADLCINNYMVNYANNEATVGDKCGGSTPAVQPVSFAEDDWSVIAANTNSNVYEVGQTKKVEINGKEYTVRIANKSTPSECSNAGFSQTACGFVVEFLDIIAIHNMNSNNTNVGGYPASALYKNYFANNATNLIYDALPSDLKNEIIDTTVISGHGSTSGETNFTSTDKLYLLSPKEVGLNISFDSAQAETRILDYYNEHNNDASRTKYYNGSSNDWWSRSAGSNYANSFCAVTEGGCSINDYATNSYGVAPAFRIG